jgi:hypothetical protein
MKVTTTAIKQAIQRVEKTTLPPHLHVRERAPSKNDRLQRVKEALERILEGLKTGEGELETQALRLTRYVHNFFLIHGLSPLECKKPSRKAIENCTPPTKTAELAKINLLGTNAMEAEECTNNLEKIFGALDTETEEDRALAEADPEEKYLPGIKKELARMEILRDATLHRLAERNKKP